MFGFKQVAQQGKREGGGRLSGVSGAEIMGREGAQSDVGENDSPSIRVTVRLRPLASRQAPWTATGEPFSWMEALALLPHTLFLHATPEHRATSLVLLAAIS